MAVTDGTTCDDGDACTQTDSCQSGACVGSNPVDCNDNNACTTDSCSGGTCSHVAVTDGTTCDDGDACTTADSCTAGVCGGAALDCNDNNACTTDSCSGGTCSHVSVADGTTCDDGDACTQTDSCQSGACVGSNPIDCNDNNACTTDSCSGGTCSHVSVADGTTCDDGDACTQTDSCQSGACVGGNPVNCNDGNSCTDDACNTTTGLCIFIANDTNACTDGDVCTTDACSGGACVHDASGACGVSGTVLYYRDIAGAGTEPSTKPVPNVGIDGTQDALSDATTGSDGTYAIGSLFGNVSLTTVAKYGSPRASDHNGAISGTDAAKIARAAVGLETLSTNQRVAGDVTGNGTLSALDAAEVARFAVLLVDHFDVAVATGSDWKFLRCDAYAYPGDPGCGAPAYDFTPISQTETGKNFHAVLYGDVTGNWSPAMSFTSAKTGESEILAVDPAAFAAVPSQIAQRGRRAADQEVVRAPTARQAVISMDALTVPLRAGDRRQLTITIANADGILGLDLSLKYDPSRVAIVGVQSAGIAAGWGVAHSDERGTHRISAYGVTPLGGDGAVLIVTVEGLAGNGRMQPFELSAVANEGAIPLRTRAQARALPLGPSKVGDR